jgi:hypothetical protein
MLVAAKWHREVLTPTSNEIKVFHAFKHVYMPPAV